MNYFCTIEKSKDTKQIVCARARARARENSGYRCQLYIAVTMLFFDVYFTNSQKSRAHVNSIRQVEWKSISLVHKGFTRFQASYWTELGNRGSLKEKLNSSASISLKLLSISFNKQDEPFAPTW